MKKRIWQKTDKERSFLEFSMEMVFVSSPYYTSCSTCCLLPPKMSSQVSEIT